MGCSGTSGLRPLSSSDVITYLNSQFALVGALAAFQPSPYSVFLTQIRAIQAQTSSLPANVICFDTCGMTGQRKAFTSPRSCQLSSSCDYFHAICFNALTPDTSRPPLSCSAARRIFWKCFQAAGAGLPARYLFTCDPGASPQSSCCFV